jgi:large subunit ribosomal protein L29
VKYQDIVIKTKSELYDSLASAKKELLGLRIQKKMAQLTDTSRIRRSRRSIAWIHTCLSQLKKSERS